MPRVSFTPNLRRHFAVDTLEVEGTTVREMLEEVFRLQPGLRSYIVDDQVSLRKHMGIFLNNELIRDRVGLSDSVGPDDEIHVMQALSGG